MINMEVPDIDIEDLTVEEDITPPSDEKIKHFLTALVEEVEMVIPSGDIDQLLSRATLGLLVKCISRVSKLLEHLEKVEETVFSLEIGDASQDAANQDMV